ncbi:MAG: CPBP family intramembrane glutamic endopeptidase [Cyanobacteria bacterium P01_G01_bin.54]
MGVTAVVLLLVAKGWQYLGNVPLFPTEVSGMAIAAGVGLALAITALSSLVHWLWPAYRRSAQLYLDLVLKPLAWPDILWLGLLPGLSEELLFRGVMLSALGQGAIALILSSVLFGTLHLSSPEQWPYMIWAMVIGFVLGSSALITGNLCIPVVAHILTNMISGILWKRVYAQP